MALFASQKWAGAGKRGDLSFWTHMKEGKILELVSGEKRKCDYTVSGDYAVCTTPVQHRCQAPMRHQCTSFFGLKGLEATVGLEPTTYCLGGSCSIH